MAYLNHFYSIPAEFIPSCRSWSLIRSNATKESRCSHLIASWVEVQPLGKLLGQAIDGGTVLDSGWQHRLRVPKFQSPSDVADLSTSLVAAWTECLATHGTPADNDWYAMEIRRVLDIFEHATSEGEALVSILEQSKFRPGTRV